MTNVEFGFREFRAQVLELAAPGKGHDAVLLQPGFAGVADGSTPLLRGGSASEARGFATSALRSLEKHRELSPIAMFDAALREFDWNHEPLASRPSCTVASVSVNADTLDVSVLGDCTVVLRGPNRQPEVVTDNRLERFDQPVAEQIAALVRSGMDGAAAREALSDKLIENRDAGNRQGSYWLFAGDPTAARHIVHSATPLAEVTEVLLYTDGFARLIEPLQVVADAPTLLDNAIEHGLARLGARLRDAEAADPSGVRHPRLSPHDDASAVLLTATSVR